MQKELEFPRIDSRGPEQILRQMMMLARYYCPEWHPDEQDGGLALVKLFTRLVEIVIGQCNRIPEKHLLAFYDFIGIDYAPATAARTPLTFQLAPGGRRALVPERTRAAAVAAPEVIFETAEPLNIVDLQITAAYSANPWEDRYSDHSGAINGPGNGFRIMGDEAAPLAEHRLCLADPAFEYRAPADLTLTFAFGNYQAVFPDYFSGCVDGTGVVLPHQAVADGNRKEIAFQLPKLLIPRTKLNGREGNWIVFQPGRPLPWGQAAALPEITGLRYTIAARDLIPEAVLMNDAPVDLKKGFYPFGETPKVGDALYIQCEEAFSRLAPGTDATVELSFTIKGGAGSGELELVWEYWDGERWSLLEIKRDTTNRLVKPSGADEYTGSLQFTCPGIAISTLNDIPGRWIRVRIAAGDYGKPGHYEKIMLDELFENDSQNRAKMVDAMPSGSISNKFQFKADLDEFMKYYHPEILRRLGKIGIASGFVYRPPDFQPPFILALHAAYVLAKTACRDGMACNRQEYRDLNPNEVFWPFPPSSEKPALFLGLEGNPANQPVSLYFSVKPGLSGVTGPRLKEPGYRGEFNFADQATGLSVQYSAVNGEWAELVISDETDGFLRSGLIKFLLPDDLTRRTVFGKNCYWLKFSFREGAWIEPPVLKGIFPNTVWAEQAAAIKDEVLGSSNGQPGQVFYFAGKSLLGDPVIEIREPSIPSAAELKNLTPAPGREPLRLVKNGAGDPEEIWVSWQEVTTFGQSDSLSRHYLLDRINGWIRFGDGVHGMIPPALPNNLVARCYLNGGGAKGNQAPGAISELKTTIPQVAGVINPEATAGGKSLEELADFLKRAPRTLTTGGRAVTREDYEWLAMEASIQVLKAKCVTGDDGAIRIVIAPVAGKNGQPPEAGLTNQVAAYLRERALAPIGKRIRVTGPDYRWIDLELTLQPVSLSVRPIMAAQVQRRLERFFDPATGGLHGNGWDFGQNLFLSDAATAVAEVAEVDRVLNLRLIKRDDQADWAAVTQEMKGKTWITINSSELPCLGTVRII